MGRRILLVALILFASAAVAFVVLGLTGYAGQRGWLLVPIGLSFAIVWAHVIWLKRRYKP